MKYIFKTYHLNRSSFVLPKFNDVRVDVRKGSMGYHKRLQDLNMRFKHYETFMYLKHTTLTESLSD